MQIKAGRTRSNRVAPQRVPIAGTAELGGRYCRTIATLWHPAKIMLTASQIAKKTREMIARAARTEDAEARNVFIDLACQYQALAVRVAKRERAERQDKSRAA
jgi:hypothetical protein